MNALSIAPAPVSRRLITVDEFLRMAETGILQNDERVELVDGEMMRMSPIGDRHYWAVTLLTRILGEALASSRPLAIQNQLQLGAHNYLVPDIVILREWPVRQVAAVPGAAEVLLLIEVSDTSLSFDLGRKLALYAKHGVAEVWVADVDERVLYVHRDPGPAGYALRMIVEEGKTCSPLCLPGCAIGPSDFLGTMDC